MASSVDDKAVLTIIEGNTKFGYDAYNLLNKTSRETSSTNPGNILLCPLSVETILALTYVAAKGETADVMSKVLHLPNDKSVVSDGFTKLSAHLKSSDVIIKTANKVFLRDDLVLAKEFTKTAVECFGADSESVNFTDPKTVQLVNDWVAKKTENKIKDIVQEFDDLTVTVLINAVYFNGKWEHPFKLTRHPMQFYVTPDTSIEVPSLQRKGQYRYYEDDNVQIVELPYKGNEYSLVIALPREMDGLAALEAQLPLDLSKLSMCEVDVTIPKFKIESKIDFTKILQNLGMGIAFSDKADFSGLLDPESKIGTVAISEVIQKCFIDVNEEGTEAAAATAVLCRRRRCIESESSACFVADHPFHFALVNVSLQSSIFIGDCNVPTL